MIFVVEVDGGEIKILDENGLAISSILDGAIRRLAVDARVMPPGVTAPMAGFAQGKIVLSATALVALRATVYTEPATEAQRSIASSSANDTAAGTGARTVKISYYRSDGSGPFYETVTMNGTSPVNTVSTTIRFVEKLEVVTAGAGASIPAGTITLYNATAGGGGALWTIAAGDGMTFSAHHYVALGKTCNITGVSLGIRGADAASFMIRSKPLSPADAFEAQVSETHRVGTNQSTIQRNYHTPIKVAGPARLTMFVGPDSTSTRTYFGSFDFYEE